MTNTQHTPSPWHRDGFNLSAIIRLKYPMGHPECKHTSGTYETIARCEGENWKANARFIVTACNNYNDLLEALERIERVEDDYSDNGHGAARLLIKKIARAAIDKAKGA